MNKCEQVEDKPRETWCLEVPQVNMSKQVEDKLARVLDPLAQLLRSELDKGKIIYRFYPLVLWPANQQVEVLW